MITFLLTDQCQLIYSNEQGLRYTRKETCTGGPHKNLTPYSIRTIAYMVMFRWKDTEWSEHTVHAHVIKTPHEGGNSHQTTDCHLHEALEFFLT